MGRIILSAFADEFSSDIDTQIKMLSENGIGYIEPRFIGEKNISELSEIETKELKSKLNFANIGVYSLGSPLGKIKLSDDIEAHMELLRHVCKLARIFGTDKIRMFSFYEAYESEETVFDLLRRMIEIADSEGVKLYHFTKLFDDLASCLGARLTVSHIKAKHTDALCVKYRRILKNSL